MAGEFWNNIDEKRGWVKTIQEAEQVRRAIEVSQCISFVSGKKESSFADPKFNSEIPENFRVRFHDVGEVQCVPYDGTPFVIIGRYERHCVFGVDKHKKKKDRDNEAENNRLETDHPVPKKKRKLLQQSKKKGCTAKIVMKDVLLFPEYKVEKDTKRAQRYSSERLHDDILHKKEKLSTERRIYIYLPKEEDHGDKHLLGELTGFMKGISKEVRDKLVELVGQGVTSVAEMRRHLRVFVDTCLFKDQQKPSQSDAAYYPSDNTIRKHIYRAMLRLRYSKIDQENLIQKVADWQEAYPNDNFNFMPASCSPSVTDEDLDKVDCVEQDDDDEIFPQLSSECTDFFFCHQTKFQRHLLYRYSNSLCLLDATYRTTKYALPLFFLAVKTNVGFSVVAEFVVQHETRASIKQGLQTIKKWIDEDPEKPQNWAWQPKFFMTDYCEREIGAIEEVFIETSVLICDFHREQSWHRWITKICNGVSEIKDQVLSMLRRCAHACTESDFDDAVSKLKESDVWMKNHRLRNWFSKTWLLEKKRWVWAYRFGEGALVNTNNGLERQNKVFKYTFLEKRKNNSLSAMITTLINEYLPAMMIKYIRENAISSDHIGRSYNSEVPVFLQNRPVAFIRHCLSKIELAETVEEGDITQVDINKYKVRSQTKNEGKSFYTVELDNNKGLPSCDCHSWQWSLLPCKHMFAVLTLTDASWEQLPKTYRCSPFITLDDDVLTFPQSQNSAVSQDLINDEDEQPDKEDTNMHEVKVPTADLLLRKKTPINPTKARAIDCREKLSLIQNATYMCQNREALIQLSFKLQEALDYIQSNLYIDQGLCPSQQELEVKNVDVRERTTPIQTTESEPALEPAIKLHKRKRKLKRKQRSIKAEEKDLLDDGEIQSDMTYPIIDEVADMVKGMSKDEWISVIKEAQNISPSLCDLTSRRAMAVLEQVVPSNDQDTTIFEISKRYSPATLNHEQRLRLSIILVSKLSETNRVQLKINVEQQDKERKEAMDACIASFLAWQNNETKTPVSEDQQQFPTTLKKRKKVHWSDMGPENERDILLEETKELPKERKTLREIWNRLVPSNYIVARVYGFNITDADIKSLQNSSWLTDQVIDAYLAHLIQKEWSRGRKIKHQSVAKMTSIINDNGQPSRSPRKCRDMEYELIVGAYHQRGHWDLVVIEPAAYSVYFYNPLGESVFQQRKVINSWRNYIGRKTLTNHNWILKLKDHAKQMDGSSCGVYCLMFAERHISGDPMTNISAEDVREKRRQIGIELLQYDDHMTDCCPCCGLSVDHSSEQITCQCCHRTFHRKNYCMGDITSTEIVNFKCKTCEIAVQ